MHKTYRINLTDTNSVTAALPVPPGAAKVSIDVQAETWGSAVVDLQYSLSIDTDDDPARTDLTNWNAFETAVQFSSATPRLRNVRVTGTGNIRLKVSTPDGDADLQCPVVVRTNWNG